MRAFFHLGYQLYLQTMLDTVVKAAFSFKANGTFMAV